MPNPLRFLQRRFVQIAWTLIFISLVPLQLSAAPGVYRDYVEPNWSTDGNWFWYRNDLAGGRTGFVMVDATKGQRTPAFDHDKVAEAIGRELGKKISGDRLPIVALRFDAEPGMLVLVGKSGAPSWRLELATGKVTKLVDGQIAAADQKPGLLSALAKPKRSSSSGVEASISFENRTGGTIEVFWVDSRGNEKSYARIPPGKTSTQHSYAGHVWRVADAEGKTLGHYEAVTGGGVAVLEKADSTKKGPVSPNTKPDVSPGPDGEDFDSEDFQEDFRSPDDAPPPARRRGGQGRRAGRGPTSPDDRYVLSENEGNLFIASKAGGEAKLLTSDGKAGDDYAINRVWWSPDGKYLVAMKVEAGQEHKVYTVESSPKDQLQPKLRTIDYLKPGDKIDHPRPRLFRVETREWIPVEESLFHNPWSIQDIRWSADSSRFTFVYNQRGHQALRVISVDAGSGQAHAVVDEKTGTFIDYSGKYFCQWIGDNELLWMSEREGWNRLYLLNGNNGSIKARLTTGDWVVQGVDRVDEKARQIWFRAGGIRAKQDPYYTHFCRVNFDGSGLTVLTEGDGDHAIQWSPGNRFLIDTWSRVDCPPVTELRSGTDGNLICKLESADASEAFASRGNRWPERFVAKGRDGKTDIYGVIFYPRIYDPAKKYPVLENIYAGPQGFFTPKKFSAFSGTKQKLADQGMIVVQCDGMGTSGRSKAFHDVCFKNLKDAGFEDRIAWIKAAASNRPAMDLSRVGIYGGSAGGQNAMAALIWHHDFYKVAVADCGCHDNRMDKIWWNEQWMSWPVDQSYADSSNAVHAGKMEGKLLLIFGEMDDNVDPASTMQVVNALEKADKDFELVIVTGAKHGAAETTYGSKRRMEFLIRNLGVK